MQQICEFHLRYARFVCVDNNCKQKLLCDECQKISTDHQNHKIIDAVTFLNNAESFVKGGAASSSIYGNDINEKTRLFLSLTENIRAEMKQNHLKRLEDRAEKYIQQLTEGLIKTRRLMLDFINESIDTCFGYQILQNRDSAREVMKSVLETLSHHLSTKEANSILSKLHSGELEKEYQEQKIKGLVDLFQVHLKNVLDPLTAQVKKYLQQYYKEMEKIKDSIKIEHFQINKTNMQIQKPSFHIKSIDINNNIQLRIHAPITLANQTSPDNQSKSLSQEDLNEEDIDQQFRRLKPIKMSKNQRDQILQSLDFTKQLPKIAKTQPSASKFLAPQSPIKNFQQNLEAVETIRENAPLYDQPPSPTNQRPSLRRISGFQTQHIQLFQLISIQKQVCISAGREGNLTVFLVSFEINDISGRNQIESIQISNQYTIKPHQELKFVELCQTPGMFLTGGRSFKQVNDKLIDQGYTVKLYLFQNLKCIEQLSEFRDLQFVGLDAIKFIGEQYLKQRFDNVKYSNELLFATGDQNTINLWRFQFDSSKTYNGEISNIVKIQTHLDGPMRGLDVQQNLIIISDTKDLFIYQLDENYQPIQSENKQIKMVSHNKDHVVKSRGISGDREMVITSQGVVYIVELPRINRLGQVHNAEVKSLPQTLTSVNAIQKQATSVQQQQASNIKGNDQTVIKTYNIKKHLRNILTEKEEKEIELADVIEVENKSFIAAFRSPLYNHYLALNKNMDICEGKFRIQAAQVNQLVYMEQESKQGILITLEAKNELGLWELKLK